MSDPGHLGLQPDDPALVEHARTWRSAYVHIPFCRRRCPYCDFAIVDESQREVSQTERYVDAVVAEIGLVEQSMVLDAVNFGGGTPTRVSVAGLARIVESLSDRFGLADEAEISLEGNPEDLDEDVLASLVGAGFNRLSLGVQSLDDDVLERLGRVHTASDAEAVVVAAREAGFRSVSVDLIFGHPSESDESWRRTVERTLAMEPDHVSTYALTVEAGTALAREIATGAPEPDDDVQASRYELFCDAASDAGIVRYEVSNHAAHGHHCRYNLGTWANADYLGFGMAAHDHVDGERSRNVQRLDHYLDLVAQGVRPRAATESLSSHDEERDGLMLGLRLAAGVPLEGLAAVFAASPIGVALLDAGVLSVDGGQLRADPMRSDLAIREALSVSDPDC